MKNILFILVFCAAFGTNVKAQFVPDFEFYLYITDAMGNRDSVLMGYGHNTLTYNDFGTDLGTTPFNDTLEIRVTDWNIPAPWLYTKSWKKGYDEWYCARNEQTFSYGIAFSTMYPPVEFSWDYTLFADDCHDNSVITTDNMQLEHPHFNVSLHHNMSAQGFMIVSLDTSDLYRYPTNVYPNQTMQSGAVDSLYFVFMTFANDSLTINVNKTEDTGIKIYPTVSSSFVNISIDNPMQPEVRIYDLNGQVLQQKKNDVQQLDISALAAGLYIVEVRNGKNAFRQKMIKI